MSFVSFFGKIVSKTSCTLINITIISGPIAGLAMKIRSQSENIAHLTCKK